MKKDEKRKLILRNIQEVLTEEELDLLLEKNNPSIYCGYETSGPVHLGHLFSVRKLIDFQKAGFKVKVLLADYHTYLNLKGNMLWIREMCEYWKRAFILCGLDEKRTDFILGSSFQTKKEYIDDLIKLSHIVTIKRALRSMREIARDVRHARVSQLIYPLMQVLDIKYLGLDAALGGTEQRKIHVLARETLPEIGWKKPICFHIPLMVSLQGPKSKMSSSKPETMISIHWSESEIRKRITSAFCPRKKEGNPIYQIVKFFIFPVKKRLVISREKKYGGDVTFNSFEEFDREFLNIHPQDLKTSVSDTVCAMLKPIRDYFRKHKKYLKPLGNKI